MIHFCIFLILVYGFMPTLQQLSSTTVLSAQHLEGTVQLVRDGNSNAATLTSTCSNETLFSTQLDSLALPTSSKNYTISVAIRAKASQRSTDDVLFSFGSFTAISNTQQVSFTLSNLDGSSVRYSLTAFGNSDTTIYSVAVTDWRRLRVCVNYSCPNPSSVTGLTTDAAGWVSLPGSGEYSALVLSTITLGSNTGTSMNATVLGIWIFPESVQFDTLDTHGTCLMDFLHRTTVKSAPPSIMLDSITGQTGLFVDAPIKVTVSAAATAGNSPLGVKLRLIFYGVMPSNCQQRNCDDVVAEFFEAAGTVQGSPTVKYSRAGRYIVRAQASDMMGGWSSKDFELLVRKVGDNHATAPCCRTTAQVIAQQLGRPIDFKSFRPAWINSSVSAVGWDWDYLIGKEDLEAERLFDYGLLAPVNTGPWTPYSCNEKYLAGFGSPTAWGTAPGTGIGIGRATNQGRNKRVAILPQGFSWASNPSDFTQQLPTCVTHWSSWIASTPYGRLNPSTGAATCSYTCTPDGVQQLVSVTGTYDRWAEAIIENSYGMLSLSADPVVLPTLYMPKGADPRQNAFAYSEAPTYDHLQRLGYDLQRDFHTILVLSPLPKFVNSGFTAWANAGGSPFIFVMRCNPQHYYLVHEYGHRVGMSHATVYKLDAGPDAVVPTTPLGPGVMEDTYSDRLDVMACCKGDYSLQNRIQSGWVPGNERVSLSLADLASASAVVGSDSSSGNFVRRYTLWPFDRPESKGQLKGVSLRVEDGKILTLGYRSTPYWQDVRIKRSSSSPQSDDRPLAPEHMRSNVAGLSVEYSKRYLDAASAQTWSIRGLLDFNLAFAHFPAALPPQPGAYPPDPPGAAFTLLREGDAWLDEEHNLLVAVERIVPCTEQAVVPVYSYSVPNFYGFRGENPGEEQVKRADYSGYVSGIKCLQLRVVTGVAASPGTLDVRVRMQATDEQDRMVLGGDQCGFPVTPKLRLILPDGVEILSIVWRDNMNRTVALDTSYVDLPPLSPLAEASVDNTDQCNSGCDWTYHVKVLAADGAQTQIDISLGSVSLSALSMTATYSYYLQRSILQATEFHSIPVVQQAAQMPTAGQGRQLLLQAAALELLGQQVFDANNMPDSSCSKQWTISINLDIPASALQPPSDASSEALIQILKVYAGSDTNVSAPGWPAVYLKASPANGTSLVVVWGESSREQFVRLQAARTNHIAVVRNRDRLGIWANSEGSWLLDNVWCVPDSQAVNYCTRASSSRGSDTGTIKALRLGHASATSGIAVTSARVYNYAIPRLSLAKESVCIEESSCGCYMVTSWPLPDASSVPAGSIDLHGVVPSVASTPIKLNSNTHYLLVGPWSECSALCGGGWATRDVRCMQLGATGQPAAQVPLEDCPLGEDIPASSKRCNTAACPRYSLQVLASQQSTCGRSCTLLGSDEDSAHLVCLNSLGQPQPLAQCCTHCTNSSEWTNIPWSNDISVLFNTSTSSLGSSVRPLQPAHSAATLSSASLASMLLQGALAHVCQSAELCVGSVKWQLGRWSPCSSSCGGGAKRRSATCVSAQTGDPLSDQVCISAIGAVPKEVLTADCANHPCTLYTWEIGSWSSCGGDASFGHSSRSVACINSKGVRVTAGSGISCTSPVPESSVTCLRSSQSTVCRPSFIAEAHYGSQDCYGHGTCTMAGCLCQVGWHGQFCEIASTCQGVVSKSDKCCTSGVLDVHGSCCPQGSLVDSAGMCCEKTMLDGCGICGGSSWTVDITGSCCNGVLDALASCCSSGAIDECGVCDGDGTTCNLHLRLLVNLPNSTDLANSSVTWKAAVESMLIAAILQAKASTQLQIQMVSAEWAPVVTAASRLVPTRSLLKSEEKSENMLPIVQDVPADQLLNARPDWTDSGYTGHCPHHGLLSSSVASMVCSRDKPSLSHQYGMATQLTEDLKLDTAASSHRLLLNTASNSTATWQAAIIDVVLMPVRASSSMYVTPAASTLSSTGITVLGLGHALAVALQPQAGSSNPAAEVDGRVQVQQVLLVQRLGVCGNRLCEVGEQSLLNGEGVAIQPALAPCPQDCPFKFYMCPAPLGKVGDAHTECGGNGKCARSQGICVCYAGYTGDACEQCEASFWPFKGRCIPQYIQGRNIFDPILLEDQEKFTGLVSFIISAIAGALALVSGSWVLYHWVKYGRIPTTLSGRLRAFRAALLGKRAAQVDTGVSMKYLLDIELELAGGRTVTVPHPRSDGGGSVGLGIEDASVLSKPGPLRHRTSAMESGVGEGDLLKAIRANMMHEHNGQVTEAVPRSPTIERTSRVLERRATGGGSRYSSLGGSIDPTQSPYVHPSSVSKTLSDVYSNIQKGVSVAGSSIARAVSNSVSRLSSPGDGYQQMMTDDDGHLLMQVPLDNIIQQEGYRDSSQIMSQLSASRAELNFSEELDFATDPAVQNLRGSNAGGHAVPFRSSFSGLTTSQAAALAQQLDVTNAAAFGVSSSTSAAAVDSNGDGLTPLGMPRLARIKTKPERQSELGTGAAGASAVAGIDSRAWSSNGGGRPMGGPGLTRLGISSSGCGGGGNSSRNSGMPGHAVAAGPSSLGLRPPAAASLSPTAAVGTGSAASTAQPPSASSWRTRADYQAALKQSSSEPVLAPHLLQEARGRKSPSEPGMASGMHVRGRAGLPEFVQTPLSGQEPTNRETIEAFGHRMERWFSPDSSGGSGTTSTSTSSGGYPVAPAAALAQLAAQRRASAAATYQVSNPFDDVKHDDCAAAAAAGQPSQGPSNVSYMQQVAAFSSDPGTPRSSAPPSQTGAQASWHSGMPRAGSGQVDDGWSGLQLPVSMGLASGSGQVLPGSLLSAGGHMHKVGAGPAGPSRLGSWFTDAAARQPASTPFGSQPGTPGAVQVALDHIPTLSSQPGGMLTDTRSIRATTPPTGRTLSGTVDGQQAQQLQQQQPQRAASQQHPWQAQVSSGDRIMSFKAWSQQHSDEGKTHIDKDGGS